MFMQGGPARCDGRDGAENKSDGKLRLNGHRKARQRPDWCRVARFRLKEIGRLYLHRCGPTLPDADDGREYAEIAVRVALATGNGGVKKARLWCGLWAPWMSEEEVEAIIAQLQFASRYWSAAEVGAQSDRLASRSRNWWNDVRREGPNGNASGGGKQAACLERSMRQRPPIGRSHGSPKACRGEPGIGGNAGDSPWHRCEAQSYLPLWLHSCASAVGLPGGDRLKGLVNHRLGSL